jgi:hypothetical protein
MLTDQEAAAKMREIAQDGDVEAAHGLADDLLCEVLARLGYVETVKAFMEMRKWYA